MQTNLRIEISPLIWWCTKSIWSTFQARARWGSSSNNRPSNIAQCSDFSTNGGLGDWKCQDPFRFGWKLQPPVWKNWSIVALTCSTLDLLGKVIGWIASLSNACRRWAQPTGFNWPLASALASCASTLHFFQTHQSWRLRKNCHYEQGLRKAWSLRFERRRWLYDAFMLRCIFLLFPIYT